MAGDRSFDFGLELGKSDTPAVKDLLDYMRVMSARGDLVTFGPDRVAAILAHIDALAADVDRLRGVIQFNREQAARKAGQL